MLSDFDQVKEIGLTGTLVVILLYALRALRVGLDKIPLAPSRGEKNGNGNGNGNGGAKGTDLRPECLRFFAQIQQTLHEVQVSNQGTREDLAALRENMITLFRRLDRLEDRGAK